MSHSQNTGAQPYMLRNNPCWEHAEELSPNGTENANRRQELWTAKQIQVRCLSISRICRSGIVQGSLRLLPGSKKCINWYVVSRWLKMSGHCPSHQLVPERNARKGCKVISCFYQKNRTQTIWTNQHLLPLPHAQRFQPQLLRRQQCRSAPDH